MFPLSILVPLLGLFAILIAASAQPYYCDGGTGRGYFEVFDTTMNKTLGCLDGYGRWTIDGNCGVYFTALYGTGGGQNADRLHTNGPAGGWCENDYTSGTNATLNCGSNVPFNNATIYTCIASGSNRGLSVTHHYVWSWTALSVPKKANPVAIFWQYESGGTADGFNIDLNFKFTNNTS